MFEISTPTRPLLRFLERGTGERFVKESLCEQVLGYGWETKNVLSESKGRVNLELQRSDFDQTLPD